MSLTFLVATYNESAEIESLLDSVAPYVEAIVVSDDGSTDDTVDKVREWANRNPDMEVDTVLNAHTGLPETVKRKGVDFIRYVTTPEQWVLMLDADERIDSATLTEIVNFTNSPDIGAIHHVWFTLNEYIDGVGPLRSFLKCRLFRASSVRFSESVHEDEQFNGKGANYNWVVTHRKSKDKQIMRENEYIKTYKNLLAEGKVTQEWVDRCIGFHYFIKE